MTTDITTPAQRAEALEGSIRKWQAIVERTGKDEGSDNCPLCHAYWARNLNCDGCPVRDRTGRGMCVDTPYALYCYANDAEKEGHGDLDNTDDAARAMLAFLESLRSPTTVPRAVEGWPTDANGSAV